ncbi:hypothetical protein [Ferrovibrio xuzhouensis]|uniref:Phasin protein n=1 Tax=Ferrovibrio xuzhouensis TaxID=1576914 RepID=A0ABV7VCD1_9PROT
MATPRQVTQNKGNGSDAAMHALQQQGERMWAVNNRMLTMYSSFMKHWLDRRQEAAKAAVEVAQKALHPNGDGQFVNIPALYGEWMNGSLQRVSADLQECQQCGTEIAGMMEEALPHWTGFSAGEGDTGAKRAAPEEQAAKE